MKTLSRPLARGATVDGPFSRDLDDAIWIEKLPDGWLVEVTISDVASTVELGTSEDVEALKQGFTRYFATGNKPMLPRNLADNVLSLLPGAARQTITFYIALDTQLVVKEFRMERTRFRNRRKLTHKYVDGLLDNENHRQHQWWVRAFELAQRLVLKRREKGALVVFDLKEGLITNEEGEVERMPDGQYYRAYLIVQEMMILCNQLITQHLEDRGVPILFRNHTTRAHELRDAYLAQMNELLLEPTQEMLARVSAEARHVMNRARYGPKNVGHFALNLPCYAHWTSPIRRYADLVNQRILHACLDGQESPYDVAALEAIGNQLNELSDSVRDKGGEAFRDKVLKRLTGADEARLMQLEPGMFSRFVKWVSKDVIVLNDIRARAIKNRIKTSAVAILDIARILFAGTEANGLWCEIKEAALEWLLANPVDSFQLWDLGHKHLGLPLRDSVSFASQKSGPDNMLTFTVTASVSMDEKEFHGETFTSLVLREGEQWALVSLIAHLANVSHVPIISTQSDSMPTSMIANAKGQLLEFCQKHRLAPAEFETTHKGQDHCRVFTTVASVVRGGTKISSDPCEGAPKKQSEQLASANLLEKLGAGAPAGDAQGAAGGWQLNPVGALMEWCQKQRVAAPEFTFTQKGADNAPVFTCTCTMQINGATKKWQAPDTNKKTSKSAAAALACAELLV